jgi:hypothetical protein
MFINQPEFKYKMSSKITSLNVKMLKKNDRKIREKSINF